MDKFGQKIRQLRSDTKQPLRMVAEALEIDVTLLSKIERGQRKANRLQVAKLANYYEVPEEELMVDWLSSRILQNLENEELGEAALNQAAGLVEERLEKYKRKTPLPPDVPFINRVKELKDFSSIFESMPNSILMLYGPKSCGKTTLVQHLVQYELNAEKYAINYNNLRGVLLNQYEDFLKLFFQKTKTERLADIVAGISINIGFFKVGVEDEVLLGRNPFKVMEDQLLAAKQKGIQPIIIIDEVQQLKHIYLEGQRPLLDELLNFFIRLTKEIHVAHIVLCTSDSFFLSEIYRNANLNKTVRYYPIGHLERPAVNEWLEGEGLEMDTIDQIWDKLGGCPWEIIETVQQLEEGKPLEEITNQFINENMNSLGHLQYNIFTDSAHKEIFDQVNQALLEAHKASVLPLRRAGFDFVLNKMVDHDFWFYEPSSDTISANSKSVWWAMKRYYQILLKQ